MSTETASRANGHAREPEDSTAAPDAGDDMTTLHFSNTPVHKLTRAQLKEKMKSDPTGGYDSTPVPSSGSGYTLKFTFHRAGNLPMSDLSSCSTDPFITAELTSGLAKRHKEDPELQFRTRTVHRSTEPVWEAVWIVAGVPAEGGRLKCRLYDEDPNNHDDRLGNVTVFLEHIGPKWSGIKERRYDVRKRMASKRAYFVRGCAAMLSKNVHMGAYLWLSIECLGESDKPWGRMYTLGDCQWFKHFSPMIGWVAGTKAPDGEQGDEGDGADGGRAEKYEYVVLQCRENLLTQSLAFRRISCNFRDLYPRNSTTALSSSSLLLQVCFRKQVCEVESSTRLFVINTHVSTTFHPRPNLASCPPVLAKPLSSFFD